MATTITASTATVTITENITLNNVDRGSKATVSIASINEVFNDIKSVATGGTELVKFTASVSSAGAGTIIAANVKYIRITNLDDTNYVEVTASDATPNDVFAVKLDAGKSFTLGSTSFDAATSGTALTPNQTITLIKGVANTSAVDVEIYCLMS